MSVSRLWFSAPQFEAHVLTCFR